MAMLIFKEKFLTFHLIGAILIITGIILSSKGRPHMKDEINEN